MKRNEEWNDENKKDLVILVASNEKVQTTKKRLSFRVKDYWLHSFETKNSDVSTLSFS